MLSWVVLNLLIGELPYMEKKILNFFIKTISFIFCFLFFSNIYAQSSTQSTTLVHLPKIPGTYGVSPLDWNVSGIGDGTWSVSFEFPSTRQLQINLSLNYTPSSSFGEASHFWSLSIPKIRLDRRRGPIKFMTASSCSSSLNDNLYIDNIRLIPISPGVWVSTGNSGRNVLRCGVNGSLTYYLSNGEILNFGGSRESRVDSEDGKSTVWYLSQKSTFSGKGTIYYNYMKPIYIAKELGLDNFISQRNDLKLKFISLPLLQSISSDDVTANISYENNNFVQPDFSMGFAQVMANRISSVRILKENNLVRNYVFEYERTELSGRLIAIKMFGKNNESQMPKTVFSYNALPFVNTGNLNIAKTAYYYFDAYPANAKFGENAQLIDLTGNGIPSNLRKEVYPDGRNIITVSDYNFSKLFDKEDGSRNSITQIKTGKLILSPGVTKWSNGFDISKSKWADMAGHGSLDWIDYGTGNNINPVIYFNDYKRDQQGNVFFQRAARFRKKDISFLQNVGCKSENIFFLNLKGDGKSDIACLTDDGGSLAILLNEGMTLNPESDAISGQYYMNFKQISLNYSISNGKRIDPENVKIIDWNNDGLSDILTYSNGNFNLYVNNGKISQGNFSENSFNEVSLGVYPELGNFDFSKIGIIDLFGSGLPSLLIPSSDGFYALANNGIARRLSVLKISLPSSINTQNFQVADLMGNGKPVLLASDWRSGSYILINFARNSFPNLLSSVLSEDGRYTRYQYSTPAKEQIESINYDNDNDVKNLSQDRFLLPFAFALVKQVSVSDGLTPTKITRYAYRVPSYDRTIGKLLSFSLVRKLNLGDYTQAGQLTEYRYLSGFRFGKEEGDFSLREPLSPYDKRLPSEFQSLDGRYTAQCSGLWSDQKTTDWCTDLGGYEYYSKSGSAQDGTSVFTGIFSSNENAIITRKILSPNLLNDNMIRGLGKVPQQRGYLAQILVKSLSVITSGASYQGIANAEVIKETMFSYDFLNRLESQIKINDPVRSGNNAITNITYFCPGTHNENPNMFCELPQNITETGEGYEARIATQYFYDPSTGLLRQKDTTNQNASLEKQIWIDEYDPYGRIIKLNKVTGQSTGFVWSQTGAELLSTLDQDGIITKATYDKYGKLIRVENSKGSIQEFAYDDFLRLIKTFKNKTIQGEYLSIDNSEKGFFSNIRNYFEKFKDFFSSSTSQNTNTNSQSTSLYQTESITYQFPKIPMIENMSTEDIQNYMKNIENSSNSLSDFPNPQEFSYESASALSSQSVTLGYVSKEKSNSESKKIRIFSKSWISGYGDVIFESNRLDDYRFSLENRSVRNTLGQIYKFYSNIVISQDDVLKNNLPNISQSNASSSYNNGFKLKNIETYYSDGTPKISLLAEGQAIFYNKGADFYEMISAEGRRSRSIYNGIGELVSIQKGLDKQGNLTNESYIVNMAYDAFGRLIFVSDNDGLEASQYYGSNGKVLVLANNRLGVGTYFYDNAGRLTNSNLCQTGTNAQECITTSGKTILENLISYDQTGKEKEVWSFRFNRKNGESSLDIVANKYGSLQNSSSPIEFGLPLETTVTSRSNLGFSKSVRKFAHNENGLIISEDLELFLGAEKNQTSVARYIVDKSFDFNGNLVALKTRGGLPRKILSQSSKDNVVGFKASFLGSASTLESLVFSQNEQLLNSSLQGVERSADGNIKNIILENNLEMKSKWNSDGNLPIAFWFGNRGQIMDDLAATLNTPGIYAQKFDYDKDLLLTSSSILNSQDLDANLSNTTYSTYDSLGRLSKAKGNWGQIDYEYSPGNKIRKVVRSGEFISNRISKESSSLTDYYIYSSVVNGKVLKDGMLQSIVSSDEKQTTGYNFSNDPLGFREYGAIASLSDLTLNKKVFVDKNKKSTKNTETNATNNEIPMQKYIWSGRGLLVGVYNAYEVNHEIETNGLLAYRMFDEHGNLLAEFDGVQINELMSETSGKKLGEQVVASKLPRFVNVTNGVVFERDELQLNVEISKFAALKFIVRYANMNAKSPQTINTNLQTRREFVIKDAIGTQLVSIDLDNKKIVDFSSREPLGLERGIPNISNSNKDQFTADGRRADSSMFVNLQSNRRDNWEIKSFESVKSNSNDSKGMRSSNLFANGYFSPQTGLFAIAKKAYDPSRGVWLSPDLSFGNDLSNLILKSHNNINRNSQLEFNLENLNLFQSAKSVEKN